MHLRPEEAIFGNAEAVAGSEMLMWEYKCHACKAKFETPVPRGPKEERNTKCPRCASLDIERMNVAKLQEPTCGG